MPEGVRRAEGRIPQLGKLMRYGFATRGQVETERSEVNCIEISKARYTRLVKVANSFDQFICCVRSERGFAINGTDPSIDVWHFDRNTVIIINKRSRFPFFWNLVLAANWNSLVVHTC